MLIRLGSEKVPRIMNQKRIEVNEKVYSVRDTCMECKTKPYFARELSQLFLTMVQYLCSSPLACATWAVPSNSSSATS